MTLKEIIDEMKFQAEQQLQQDFQDNVEEPHTNQEILDRFKDWVGEMVLEAQSDIINTLTVEIFNHAKKEVTPPVL